VNESVHRAGVVILHAVGYLRVLHVALPTQIQQRLTGDGKGCVVEQHSDTRLDALDGVGAGALVDALDQPDVVVHHRWNPERFGGDAGGLGEHDDRERCALWCLAVVDGFGVAGGGCAEKVVEGRVAGELAVDRPSDRGAHAARFSACLDEAEDFLLGFLKGGHQERLGCHLDAAVLKDVAVERVVVTGDHVDAFRSQTPLSIA
jgi:hypothetical protein